MEIELSKSEIEMEQNPLLLLGFGINAYFNIIKQMLYLMIGVLIINLPLFYIYGSYGAIQNDAIASVSMGNMGGAVSICSYIPHNYENVNATMKLECPSGRLNIHARGHARKKILQMGIVFQDKLEINVCSESVLQDPYNCS